MRFAADGNLAMRQPDRLFLHLVAKQPTFVCVFASILSPLRLIPLSSAPAHSVIVCCASGSQQLSHSHLARAHPSLHIARRSACLSPSLPHRRKALPISARFPYIRKPRFHTRRNYYALYTSLNRFTSLHSHTTHILSTLKKKKSKETSPSSIERLNA